MIDTSNYTQDRLGDILELTEVGENTSEFKDEEAKPSAKLRKNPRFRDVEETGRWGELRRKEICGVLVSATLVVISVAVVVFWISFSSTAKEIELNRTRAKLNTVLSILQERNHTFIEMPSDTSFYSNSVVDDESSPAYHRAMKWFLSDSYDFHDEYFLRFVLASLYFELGGEAWKSSTNWMTPAKTCHWFGVECALGNEYFQGLNLDNNGLVGSLTSTIGLLGNVSNIWLSDNQIFGTIPGDDFSKLSKLAFLGLGNNRLSGTIPDSLSKLTNLGVLYVQENNLSGRWPFCPLLNNETKKYEKYGFDCDKIACSEECCEDISCYKSFGQSNQ